MKFLEILSCPALPDLRHRAGFLKVPQTCLLCSTDQSNMVMKMTMEHRRNVTDRGKPKYKETPSPVLFCPTQL